MLLLLSLKYFFLVIFFFFLQSKRCVKYRIELGFAARKKNISVLFSPSFSSCYANYQSSNLLSTPPQKNYYKETIICDSLLLLLVFSPFLTPVLSSLSARDVNKSPTHSQQTYYRKRPFSDFMLQHPGLCPSSLSLSSSPSTFAYPAHWEAHRNPAANLAPRVSSLGSWNTRNEPSRPRFRRPDHSPSPDAATACLVASPRSLRLVRGRECWEGIDSRKAVSEGSPVSSLFPLLFPSLLCTPSQLPSLPSCLSPKLLHFSLVPLVHRRPCPFSLSPNLT